MVGSSQRQQIINKEFIAHKQQILEGLASNLPDRSPKGNVDTLVWPIVSSLNDMEQYVTTSSCSGRISIYSDIELESRNVSSESSGIQGQGEDGDGQDIVNEGVDKKKKKSKKKKGGQWIMVSHDRLKVNEEDANDVISKLFPGLDVIEEDGNVDVASTADFNSLIYFKFEPFILHVSCSDADTAKQFLLLALECGYRNSGIVESANRHMVAVRSTLKMDAPIATVTKDGVAKLLVSKSYLAMLVRMANSKFGDNEARMELFHSRIRSTFYNEGNGVGDGKVEETKEERRERKRREGLLKQEMKRQQMGNKGVVVEAPLMNEDVPLA